MKKLEGKVALVTGGATGIGRATIEKFVAEGAKIVIVDYNKEKSNELVEMIESKGGDITFFEADVSDEKRVVEIFKATEERYGKIDILFNNAGIGSQKPTEDTAFDEWRKIVSIDLDAVFIVAREAIKQMLGRGGVIVNNASMYGHVGAGQTAAYNAAKGGVVNLTRALGLEYATRDIRVNAICPGFVDTPLIPEDAKETLIGMTPMQRLGTSEEIADAVLFLASNDSSFMTGASLIVDGGYTAG